MHFTDLEFFVFLLWLLLLFKHFIYLLYEHSSDQECLLFHIWVFVLIV